MLRDIDAASHRAKAGWKTETAAAPGRLPGALHCAASLPQNLTENLLRFILLHSRPMARQSAGMEGMSMKLVELVEQRSEALRVRDVAPILGISIQQVYKLAARGQIPSFRVASSVRFDPQLFADWMRQKYPSRSQGSISPQVLTA